MLEYQSEDEIMEALLDPEIMGFKHGLACHTCIHVRPHGCACLECRGAVNGPCWEPAWE